MSIPTTHPFAFNPTYGMTLADLRAIVPPEAPPGFDAFWQARYERAIATDPQPVLRKSSLTHPDWQVLDITYKTLQSLLQHPATDAAAPPSAPEERLEQGLYEQAG